MSLTHRDTNERYRGGSDALLEWITEGQVAVAEQYAPLLRTIFRSMLADMDKCGGYSTDFYDDVEGAFVDLFCDVLGQDTTGPVYAEIAGHTPPNLIAWLERQRCAVAAREAA